jgi:transposase
VVSGLYHGYIVGAMNHRQLYPTDMTDAEWSCLEPHVPLPKPGGRLRVHPVREILNAIFYILRSGCAWRLLSHDLPPWKTVYHYFRLWQPLGSGRRSIPPCGRQFGPGRDVSRNRALPLWIVNRSRPPEWEVCEAMMEPRS